MEKDSIILSHRELICKLHEYIQKQNETIDSLKFTVSQLKNTLLNNNIEVPKIVNDVI